MVNLSEILLVIFAIISGSAQAQNGDLQELKACKRACYEQFITDTTRCRKETVCKEMEFRPPNIDNYIPEAYSFLCYDDCKYRYGPFPVSIKSMMRKENLVMTNITWDEKIAAASKQCLVTWEVSGGGLMGNLLTDCCLVELSLWPDTAYNIHVTCKTKEGHRMVRSQDLIIDTTGAQPIPKARSTTTTTSTASSESIDNNFVLERISETERKLFQKEETIVGTAISILLLIAIAAILIVYRNRRTPKSIEKEILIYKDLGIVSPTTLHV